MAVVLGMGSSLHSVPGASSQPQTSLSLNDLPRRPTLHTVSSRSELSPLFGRSDGFHTMSFVSLSDITTLAERVDRLYEYGWSSVKNPSMLCSINLLQASSLTDCPLSAAQYFDLGQDIHRLYDNIGQVENVFHSVQARCTKTIPQIHPFHDVASLNNILEDPFKTIKECRELLRRRNTFSEERGAIKNMYWNVLVEVDVIRLHAKVKNHNVKILALLKPLEMCVYKTSHYI
jgi:hypothetical protein